MKAVFLMGPTASGKTALALELARDFPFEIVSVDSAQVFRHMDIGTAKPDRKILASVPHHLIDIIDPVAHYSAGEFLTDTSELLPKIAGRGKIPLLAGGTMLYFKALSEGLNELPRANKAIRAQIDEKAHRLGWAALHGELMAIDPITARRLEPADSQRIQRALEVWMISGKPLSELLQQEKKEAPFDAVRIALLPSDRSVLHARIAKRFESMLEAGLVEETESLRKRFDLDPAMPAMRTVGYRQAWQYLDGEFGKKELVDKGVAATRQLAKRQLTWLRSMENVQQFDCLDPALHRKVGDFLRKSLDE